MQEIDTQRKRLDALFEKSNEFSDNAELLSHWAKYLCVLVCGFLENSVEMCLAEYCKRHGDEKINNFVSIKLRSFQNPKMGKILELFGSFNKVWEERLKIESSDRISDSVNSIVTNRHKIAHGDTSNLTMSSLKAYYTDVVKAVEIMRRICGLSNA